MWWLKLVEPGQCKNLNMLKRNAGYGYVYKVFQSFFIGQRVCVVNRPKLIAVVSLFPGLRRTVGLLG